MIFTFSILPSRLQCRNVYDLYDWHASCCIGLSNSAPLNQQAMLPPTLSALKNVPLRRRYRCTQRPGGSPCRQPLAAPSHAPGASSCRAGTMRANTHRRSRPDGTIRGGTHRATARPHLLTDSRRSRRARRDTALCRLPWHIHRHSWSRRRHPRTRWRQSWSRWRHPWSRWRHPWSNRRQSWSRRHTGPRPCSSALAWSNTHPGSATRPHSHARAWQRGAVGIGVGNGHAAAAKAASRLLTQSYRTYYDN